MSSSTAEQAVLDRYRAKCQMAGGARAGYVLRRRAILFVQDDYPDLDFEKGIAALQEQGLLKASASGDFLFLTAAGVESIDSSDRSSAPQAGPS